MIAAIERLNREDFIQLPQADVINPQSVALEQPGDGVDRSEPHLFRTAPCDGDAAVPPKRRAAAPGCLIAGQEDAGGGAVGELAGVPSCDHAAFDDRFQPAQVTKSGGGPVAFIAVQPNRLHVHFAVDLVPYGHRRL